MEAAFRCFGGLPQEVLFDNARALVEDDDAATREVRFNERLHGFARYWGFRPRACAPCGARTKGKDERGVAPGSQSTAGRGRLQFGMLAGIKSEFLAGMRRNSQL